MKSKKNSLAYSPLTEKVYWIDGNGQSHDVHQNFIQMMLLWLSEGELPSKEGEGFEKDLTVDGKVEYTLRIYKGIPRKTKTHNPS